MHNAAYRGDCKGSNLLPAEKFGRLYNTILHHEKKGGYFNPLESIIEKNTVRWLGPPYSDLNWGLDLVSSAIFFSMHIWNLIHDAPFHCHRNVTAPSRKYRVSPSLSCSTKCHSWTSSVWHEGKRNQKSRDILQQLILMTKQLLQPSIKTKMIYTRGFLLDSLYCLAFKRKINFLYVTKIPVTHSKFHSMNNTKSFCKLACHSTFLNTS